MKLRRVRTNAVYTFVPVLIDRTNRPYNVLPGDRVRVVRLPGCPPPGTMGHAHVAHLDGTFAGLVCVNSLVPVRRSK